MKYKIGRFTSSGIHNLMTLNRKKDGFGAPALNYINEKNIEWKLGRNIRSSAGSQAAYWGYIMEKACYELLPLEYKLVSDVNFEHPTMPEYWSGSPDLMIGGDGKIAVIAEIKSYQMKKYAQYTDMLMLGDIDIFRKNFAQEYWQIVSNVIINNADYGEAISFMPTKRDLLRIRDDIENGDMLERYGYEPWHYRFIVEKKITDLAYIPDNGYYNNITKFRFVVPEADKELLTSKVQEAKQLLIKLNTK